MPFQVCLFEDGVQAVPLNWIQGDICKYPPYINQIKINKAIATMEEPDEIWISHKVLRKFGNPSEKYTDAVEKAKLAEKFSDIDSQDDDMPEKIKRKERAAKRLYFDDDEEEWIMDSPKPLPSKQQKKREPEKQLPKLPVPPGRTVETRKSPRKHAEVFVSGPSQSPFSNLPPQQTKTPKSPTKSPKKTASSSKKTDKDLNSEVLRKLNLILYRVKQVEAKIDELVEGRKTDECQNLDPIDTDIFPLRTKEEMTDFERMCKEDPQYIQKCVMALKYLGGSSTVDTAVKILKRVLTNTLAEQYSLLGRKKNGFKNLSLYKVIFYTVRVHFKDATEKELDPIVARWLVQAKMRRARSEKARATDVSQDF